MRNKILGIIAVSLLGVAIYSASYVRYDGSIVTYNGLDTLTGGTAVGIDTNRLSGTQSVRAGLYNVGLQTTEAQGVIGWVVVGDLANAGDAAFGNVDTAIIAYYTELEGHKTFFETDTLALLPDTSFLWDVADSIWDYTDGFGFTWYLADSTEDFAGSDDTIECAMTWMFRVIEE